MERAARCLAGEGFRVVVVGWDREMRFPTEERRAEGVTILRIRAKGGYGWGIRNLAGLILFNFQLLRLCWRLRPAVFHAVDLDTVITGLLVRRLFGSRVFYDIADWYSMSRPRTRIGHEGVWALVARVVDRFENWVVRRVDCVCLPHEERAGRLSQRPRRLVVVHNSPEEGSVGAGGRTEASRSYVIYLGGLYEDRGIEDMLLAAKESGIELVVGGFGPLEGMCERAAGESRAITFVGRVAYEESLRLQAGARAIIALYDPRLEMNRLAAPYKLYEAMMLGKPVIVAADTLPGKLAGQEKIGLVVRYGDRRELGEAMRYLVEHPAEAAEMGARARRLYEERFRWSQQCERLRRAYAELLSEERLARLE